MSDLIHCYALRNDPLLHRRNEIRVVFNNKAVSKLGPQLRRSVMRHRKDNDILGYALDLPDRRIARDVVK
jgi:hypothetical protein